MQDREPTRMKRLLERLLAARARRDREERYSDAWRAADTEMHRIERAIFRVPLATDETPASDGETPSPVGRRSDDPRGQAPTYGSRLAG